MVAAPIIESLREHADVENPILSVEDIAPIVGRQFVADPFIIQHHDTYYMLFEVNVGGNTELIIERDGQSINLLGYIGANISNRRYTLSYLIEVLRNGLSGLRNVKREGIIGVASSEDGLNWSYEGKALSESTHLAYPYVFSHNGSIYMTPDKGGKVGEFRIYRATNFPYGWEHIDTPIKKQSLSDPTPLRVDGEWYCFFSEKQGTSLYHSPHLIEGNWSKHPESPVSTAPHSKRPAGRPIRKDRSIHLFLQDCENGYGSGINEYKILNLTPESYEHQRLTQESVTGSEEWNKDGIHHIDASHKDESLIIIDGHINYTYSVGLFEME